MNLIRYYKSMYVPSLKLTIKCYYRRTLLEESLPNQGMMHRLLHHYLANFTMLNWREFILGIYHNNVFISRNFFLFRFKYFNVCKTSNKLLLNLNAAG